MTGEEELAEARARIADLEAELHNAHTEREYDARRRANDLADELLTCALTIAGLSETEVNELDIALDTVRRRAEEHGILRHQPPRAVT